MKKTWKQSSQVFNDQAEEYDSWFENSLLFDIELAAIQDLSLDLPLPRLELGVGPGRFAEQLGVTIGIDPAAAALEIAADRGIQSIRGIGEQLPLLNHSVGTLYMLFTLCFLSNPQTVFAECKRVLHPEGVFVLGLIPEKSAWGQQLNKKKKQQHPYYQYADFAPIAKTKGVLQHLGFAVTETRSTLLQRPEALQHFEQAQPGMNEEAGFCVLAAQIPKNNQ